MYFYECVIFDYIDIIIYLKGTVLFPLLCYYEQSCETYLGNFLCISDYFSLAQLQRLEFSR